MEDTLNRAALVTAMFDDQSSAHRAIDELRENGVGNDALSMLGRHEGEGDGIATGEPGDPDVAENAHVARGAIGGGALGAGLAVAALAIPGVGPLVAAGAVAAAAVPAALTTGVVVGAGLGGLGEVLHDRGIHKDDAAYYADRFEAGGIMVGVDPSMTSISPSRIDEILMRHGGHRATGLHVDDRAESTLVGSPSTTASTGTPTFSDDPRV